MVLLGLPSGPWQPQFLDTARGSAGRVADVRERMMEGKGSCPTSCPSRWLLRPRQGRRRVGRRTTRGRSSARTGGSGGGRAWEGQQGPLEKGEPSGHGGQPLSEQMEHRAGGSMTAGQREEKQQQLVERGLPPTRQGQTPPSHPGNTARGDLLRPREQRTTRQGSKDVWAAP